MDILFTTEKNNLPDFFEKISRENIQDCCESKVYHRGLEYHKFGAVIEASYNDSKTQLKGIVKGNSNYTVSIELQNGEVSGFCTCPYGGVCKHIVATLFYAIDDDSEIDIIPDAKNTGIDTKQYLQSLSTDELIGLVTKFAPEQFWVETKNKFSDSSYAQSTFKIVERNIQKIFKDSDYLDNPNDFGSALDSEVKQLSGLEKHLKGEIEGLLFFIIDEVDNAFDEGYLYDHYNDYNYEPSVEFNEFVANYIKCLASDEKTTFLTKLDALIDEKSYDTFGNFQQISETVFTESDLPLLKNTLVSDYKKISHQLIGHYFERVRHLLSLKEKEIILSEVQNESPKWLIELVKLYDSQNEIKKAIEVIKDWLPIYNGSDKQEVYTLYLDMLKKAGGNLTIAAKEAITNCPTCSMLQKISAIVNVDQIIFETILEHKDPGQLLNYLVTNERLSEALALIKRSKSIWDNQVNDFFKKHKSKFVPDAEKYFSERINKNLESAGDSYYHAVSDTIQQLRQINRSLADEYLKDIRLNYNRRRNLISILSKF